MYFICPECNKDMHKYAELLLVNCNNCKISFCYDKWENYLFTDPIGDFYINDINPLVYGVKPLFIDKTFEESCRLYKLKVFL